MLHGGACGRAIAPAGASKGSGEALDRRDGGGAFGGYDVQGAVAAVNEEIAPALRGLDATDQAAVDRRLIELDGTPDKSRLGANATIATSMAAAHAAAAAAGAPLWRHLRPVGAALPLPEIQIFGGGAHAGRRVDIQDFMVVCPGAATFAQALEWTAEVYRAAGALMAEAGRLKGVADEGGYWPDFATNEEALEMLVRAIERAGLTPGEQVAIALDVAASEFGRNGRYRLGLEGRELDSAGMIALLLGWLERYPIVSIEDPLAEDDPDGFRRVHARGQRTLPGGCRRPHRDRCRTGARRGGSESSGHAADQAQPARHAERDAGGLGSGARGRLGRHRLGALGRDRGCDDRPPRHRLGRAAAQGRLVRPLRAHGQVERGAAHRGGAGGGREARPAVCALTLRPMFTHRPLPRPMGGSIVAA